jgi:serine/threonine protein kinase
MNALRSAAVERFRKLRLLGEGATSRVFEVEDLTFGGRAALKQLKHERRSTQRVARFKDEFRVLANLSHPNLAKGYELFADEPELCLSMELVVGVDFLSYVRPGSMRSTPPSATYTGDAHSVPGMRRAPPFGGTLNSARLRSALAQLVDGLRALHAARRVHCDIKPENVLVSADGRVVIIDLGSSCRAVCRPGEYRGTPGFMSPEQRAGHVSEAADWYAVGALLHSALTGRLPLGASSGSLDATEHYQHPIDPRVLASGLPDDLVRLALRLLNPQPLARPSGEELSRILGGPQRAVWLQRSA